ncbi:alpha/beta fold hydrolase [Streptomyces sp. NPDC101116]|uniref:alpha/beta fold hydrolase n=1 Tax=Streptomyces sp. NPDC101116 TaxID=3366107 RepID=UPI00380313FD
MWHEIAPALAAVGHHVHVWDMAGYGTSGMHSGQDVSLAAQGRVFTELLAHWGLREPSVIAHDFGGCVALRAHLLHGAHCRRLALVDPVALEPCGSPFFHLSGSTAGCSSSSRRRCTRPWCASTAPPPATSACAPPRSTRWCGPGRGRWGRRRSTGRSRRPTSAAPTRSSLSTRRSTCPSPSAGAPRTPGSPSPRGRSSRP